VAAESNLIITGAGDLLDGYSAYGADEVLSDRSEVIGREAVSEIKTPAVEAGGRKVLSRQGMAEKNNFYRERELK